MLEFSNPIPLEGLETSSKDSTEKENDKSVQSCEHVYSNDSKLLNQPMKNEKVSAKQNDDSVLIHDSNPWTQKGAYSKWNGSHCDSHYLKFYGVTSFVIICSLLIFVVLRVNLSCKKTSI